MIDKRFWAGAILAVTVVVAGAGSLPALLLRPVAADPPLVALAPTVNVAEPVQAPVQAKADPPPVVAAAAVAVAEPPKPSPPPAPQVVAAPLPEPAPVREAAPVFPPVQPVGITTPAQPVATPPTDAPAARVTDRAPQRVARAERTAKPSTRKRAVRPAPYPMREFLAWRR
jgi:hypothetical protein